MKFFSILSKLISEIAKKIGFEYLVFKANKNIKRKMNKHED